MPSMSPRTQQLQMGAGAGVDQASQMFEKGFSEMAYNVLLSRFPDIVQDVVTFKILDTDLDKGMGMGAFVLMRNDQPLYIPVVMAVRQSGAVALTSCSLVRTGASLVTACLMSALAIRRG